MGGAALGVDGWPEAGDGGRGHWPGRWESWFSGPRYTGHFGHRTYLTMVLGSQP